MGYKGLVNMEDYQAIADALVQADDEFKYCRIEFIPLEYDRANGSAVYSSLKQGKLH